MPLWGAAPSSSSALWLQVPDTVEVPDTIQPPDTLPEVVGPEEDEEEERVPVDFPLFPTVEGTGPVHGVWEWDREGLLGTRAFTLVELLEEIPGAFGLRSGDHGHPAVVTAFGLTGGRIRVFQDGFELPPLDGGTPDLARISLGGLDRVRVERRPGELRIHLRGLRVEEPDPYSLVQAGTGDLNTNFFRGTFAHPDALGGNVTLSLDRLDTDGRQRRHPGALFGTHFRYSLHREHGGGLGFEFRRFSTRRPEEAFAPGELVRTDWLLRSRWPLREELTGELFVGRSRLVPGSDGESADLPSEARATFDPDPRGQVGARIRFQGESAWGDLTQTVSEGEGWPRTRSTLQVGGRLADWGGGEATVAREGWPDASGGAIQGRIWTRPFSGVTLFAEAGTDRRGLPYVPPPEPGDEGEDDPENSVEEPIEPEPGDPDLPRFSERTGVRAGAEYRRGDLAVSAAWVGLSTDSLPPFGLPMDREAAFAPGGETGAVEVSADVPIPVLEGLRLRASAVRTVVGETQRYVPATVWDAGLVFHDTFFPTDNLEVWVDAGAKGRDRMLVAVPLPGEGEVGAGSFSRYQPHWYFRLQIRVVTVRAFLNWENATNRVENHDFLDRPLPGMRVVWGIRWTMWN